MRAFGKWMVVGLEVLAFSLAAAAVVRAADYPALRPTYVAPTDATASPYRSARPVKVLLTNAAGQATTLEYRRPVQIVDERTTTTTYSSPARDADLFPSADARHASYDYPDIGTLREVRYAGQPSLPLVQTSSQVRTVNAAPAACTAPQLPVANYAAYPPALNYGTYPAPQQYYRPVTQVPVVPVVQTNVQVGSGIYGQPVIYRPGQPLRNALRWLTP